MSYRRYALERLAWALVLVWVAVSGVFLMFREGQRFDPEAQEADPSPALLAQIARQDDYFGTGEPFFERYWAFLAELIGDLSLGESFLDGSSVNERVTNAVPPTLSLLLVSFVLATLVAVPLGIVWGVRRPGRITDPLQLLTAVMIGLPPVFLGFYLLYFVGFRLELLPQGGYCDLIGPTTACGGFADWARALVLPGVALGALFAAVYLRLVSALVRDAERARKNDDETARTSAALGYVKLLGRDFGFAIGLSVLVEQAFGIPGLGSLFLQHFEGFDLPVVEGVLIAATLLAASVNLAVDLTVAAFEPRFRRF